MEKGEERPRAQEETEPPVLSWFASGILADNQALATWLSTKNPAGNYKLDPTSSPGYPWNKIAPTNGECFGYTPGLGYSPHCVLELRFQIIKKLVELEHGASLYPVYVFIKSEPHKPAKAAEGRWRLIAGVSCVDRLAHDLLLGPFLDTFNDSPFLHNTACGWQVFCENGLQHFNTFYPHRPGHTWDCADKSSWDWTVQPWLYEVFRDLLCWFCDFSPQAQRVAYNLVTSLGGLEKSRIFDIGRKVTVRDQGIILSGSLLTLHMNSIMQLIVHAYADVTETLPFPLTMGDDTLQPNCPPEYWAEVVKAGVILKQVDRLAVPEFCGMTMDNHHFDPVYKDKHAFLLYYCQDEIFDDLLRSYVYLYMFDDRKVKAIQYLQRLRGNASAVADVSALRQRILGVA